MTMIKKIVAPREVSPGVWRSKVVHEPDATGKCFETTKTFRGDRTAAMRAFFAFEKEVTDGTYRAPTELMLVDYIKATIRDRAAALALARATVEKYHTMVRLYIEPHFGGVKLQKVTSAQIQALYTKMTEAGLDWQTVRLAHAVLGPVFKRAFEQRPPLIAFNPMHGVSPPKSRPKRGVEKALRPDALARILTLAKGHPDEDLLRFWLATGMRRGEALGLTWENVDLVEGFAEVTQQLCQYEDGSTALAPPKSGAGRRCIGLAPEIVTMLGHRYREAVRAALAAGEPVGRRRVFGTRTPTNMTSWMRRLCARAGVKGSLHSLRHTYCTRMLDNGLDAKLVSDQAGHTNVSFTQQNYRTVTPENRRRAGELAGRVLLGDSNQHNPDAKVLPFGKG